MKNQYKETGEKTPDTQKLIYRKLVSNRGRPALYVKSGDKYVKWNRVNCLAAMKKAAKQAAKPAKVTKTVKKAVKKVVQEKVAVVTALPVPVTVTEPAPAATV